MRRSSYEGVPPEMTSRGVLENGRNSGGRVGDSEFRAYFEGDGMCK